jgi:hypothetical protein
MAASTLGTAVGLCIAPLAAGTTAGGVAVFLGLSAVHLTCMHQSLAALALRTLSGTRLRLACQPALAVLLQQIQEDTPRFPPSVLTPHQVAAKEPILPLHMPGAAASPPYHDIYIMTGTPLEKLGRFEPFWRARDPKQKYVVVVERDDKPLGGKLRFQKATGVHVLYLQEANWRDVLCGYVHAALTTELLAAEPAAEGICADKKDRDVAMVTVSMHPLLIHHEFHAHGLVLQTWSKQAAGIAVVEVIDPLIEALERAGWWVHDPVLTSEVEGRLSVPTQTAT